MLGKRIINTGGVSCTTDTTQILDGGTTQSIALYRFEDNADDTSESTGYINKGARFNGSSSKITVSGNPFNLTTYSLSFWIYATDYNQSGTSIVNIGLDNTGGTWGGLAFGVNANKVFYYGGDSGFFTQTGTTNITNANWVHVAIVVNGTSITGYINGTQDSGLSKTLGSNIAYRGGSINTIGVRQGAFGSYGWWNGDVDELRVYNDALTAAEIGYIANNTTASIPTANLIAFYSFEGNANDSTSNNNDGAAINVIYDYSGTASNITYATGKFGKAAVYNGSNSNITLPTGLGSNGDRSRSFWINVDNLTNAVNIFYLGNSSSNAYYETCSVQTNGKIRYQERHDTSTNSVSIDSSSSIVAGTWYNIVYVFSGSVRTLYINGVQEAQTTSSYTTVNNTSYPGFIGSFRNAITNTDGLIDQVRMFNKALSPGEVNSLYNETTTTAALGTISNPSTIAYYKMQDNTDETGSYNATTTNNVDFNVEGKYGFAGKFNGTNSYMTTGLTWPGGTQLSWSGWVKTSNTKNTYIFGDFNAGGANATHRFSIRIYSQNLQASVNDAGGGLGTNTTFGTFAHYGEWAHLAIIVNGTTIKAYVNGSQLGSTGTTSESLVAGVNAFVLGNYGATTGAAQQFDGTIDQVRIFNKAISADEVTKLYNEIQCANAITTPESYFNTRLWTGDGNARSITDIGFNPDFVWIKKRANDTKDHRLFDTIRGANKVIYSSRDLAQGTPTNELTAFVTGGFSLGNASAVNDAASDTYVSWNWKSASSNTINNDGTIQSTVRASQESGFSIVTYSPNNTVGMSIGHGLSKAPSLVITKRLDTTQDWGVYTNVSTGNTTTNWLSFNDYDAYGSGSFMTLKPTTLELSQTGAFWGNGGNQVAYCFANVDGYQRIGSYVGNGSTNGPFVYTGFEPAWLMVKRTDANGNSWAIFDNKRVESNGDQSVLFVDTSSTESDYDIDFATNGFIIKATTTNVNANGGSYIFMAIAANPDTTAPTKVNSFKAKIYPGDGGTQSFTDIGFKPDFIWIKERTNASAHALYDSVRGKQSVLLSNGTNAATDQSSDLGLESFDENGFTVDYPNSGDFYINRSSKTYVAWSWKAGDHDRNLASINNDGSITSLVSANPEAGFSIVRNFGTSNYSDTIGHGLSQPPEIVIQKGLSHSVDWYVLFNINGTGGWDYGKLNKTDQFLADSPVRFSTNSTTINNWGWTNYDMINYCWHSVAGYSKIGTYDGGTNGKQLPTGFKASWIMIKKYSSGTGRIWYIYDDQRDGVNDNALFANLNNAESSGTNFIDFNDTNIQINATGDGVNGSGSSYLYMAFK